MPENLEEGTRFKVGDTPYLVGKNGELIPNPAYVNDPNMIGEKGAEGGPKSNITYWPSAMKKEFKNIRREARMKENDFAYEAGRTDWDRANRAIGYEIREKQYEREIAEKVGNDAAVKSIDADIQSMRREQTTNEYEKAVEGSKRLQKRQEIDARQYQKDQRAVDVAERKLNRHRKQMDDDQIKAAEMEIEKLKQRRDRSKAQAWKSARLNRDAQILMSTYEGTATRPLWDINQSFSSRGTFSAEEARGMDTMTWIAEWKQQTELLESIDENISAMATGEWI